jgi:hypothetical protein
LRRILRHEYIRDLQTTYPPTSKELPSTINPMLESEEERVKARLSPER